MQKDKELLAKLMATENITVVFQSKMGAAFDTASRVLYMADISQGLAKKYALPEKIVNNMQDLLIGHEVGHALYTKAEDWEKARTDKKIPMGIINVIEDVRIERKIAEKYPGMNRIFSLGYQGFLDPTVDFFELQTKDANKMNSADRINIAAKGRQWSGIQLTPAEQTIFDEAKKADTWDEVLAVSQKLYDLVKDWVDPDDKEKGLGWDPFDMDGDQDCQGTFDKHLDEVSNKDQAKYMQIPYILNPYIWIHDYKTVLLETKYGNSIDGRERYPDFILDKRRVIEQMLVHFKTRQSAKAYTLQTEAATGVLNPKKLYSHKYSEDIFNRLTISHKEKNHGLIIIVDWSSSMINKLKNTVNQLLILTGFCEKLAVPYEVYTFTDPHKEWISKNPIQTRYKTDALPKFIPNEVTCLNVLSSRMNQTEYKQMANFLLARAYAYGEKNSMFHMSGTPLMSALTVLSTVAKDFRIRNRLDKLLTVLITDGDATDEHAAERWIDCQTSIEYSKENGLSKFMQMMKDRTGSINYGFYISNSNLVPESRVGKTIIDKIGDKKTALEKIFQRGYISISNLGFDKFTFANISKANIDIRELDISYKSKKAAEEAIIGAMRDKGTEKMYCSDFAKFIG